MEETGGMAPLLRPAFPACLCRVHMQFTCFVIFPAADVLLLCPGLSALGSSYSFFGGGDGDRAQQL